MPPLLDSRSVLESWDEGGISRIRGLGRAFSLDGAVSSVQSEGEVNVEADVPLLQPKW